MPWLARSQPAASSSQNEASPRLSTTRTSTAQNRFAEPFEAPTKRTAPKPTAHHGHRRHFSSVASKDYDFNVARCISQKPATAPPHPPHPSSWSITESEEEEEEEDGDSGDDKNSSEGEENNKDEEEVENDGEDETMVYSPANATSYRHSTVSNISTSTMSSTATTSTLRRYWSPSTPSSPLPAQMISSSSPQMPSSPPPYRTNHTNRRSVSPTLTPGGSSTMSSSSPSSAASSAASTAPSTAPSTSHSLADDIIHSTALDHLPVSQPYTSEHVVTYIPPLVDGAGGTLSRWQRANQRQTTPSNTSAIPRINRISRISSPNNNSNNNNNATPRIDAHHEATVLSPYRLLWSDLRWLALASPELVRMAWNKTATPVWAVARPRVWSHLLSLPVDDVADAAEAVVQTVLAVSELAMLGLAPTLFLCLPGSLFVFWLLGCMAFLRLASWPLNGGAQARTGTVYRGPWDMDVGNSNSIGVDNSSSDDDDSEDDDEYQQRRRHTEKWYFVSGMGATSRSLAKTGPRVAGVFGRPVTLIRPAYTYGAVADFLLALLQRLLLPFCVLSAPGADTTVYAELRQALRADNDSKNSRIVILAHNTGATAVAQALARLAGDVPTARLAQIQVYTFGSVAPDFVLPRDSTSSTAETACHVEHIAHAHDPCARFGVLRSVRHDLAGRYCGGIFVVGSSAVNNTAASSSNAVVGLGLGSMSSSLSTTTGFRPASRGRSFSPPLPVATTNSNTAIKRNSLNNNNNYSNNRHYRMSFPLSYQQLQQHQQFLHGGHHAQRATYRRSVSATSSTTLVGPTTMSLSSTQRKTMLSMEDYLTALFGPEPWSMRPDTDLVDMDMGMGSDGSTRLSCDAFFLDAVVSVDRELAEKREMAALAAASTPGDPRLTHRPGNDRTNSLRLAKNAHHRLSWTGLGATAKYGTTKGSSLVGGGIKSMKPLLPKRSPTNESFADRDSQPLLGLETVRRICKEYDGQPGRNVSLLAGYFSDAVARHREQFGF
ncbi:hypothetical protein SBRCBS47491_001409 [Sporothrix bragantina]|uniref:Transmembrane protein n=1 Tax=Sporothrix bragantina TaxID=671064 RepID=A0ABP0AYS9_9PEZI